MGPSSRPAHGSLTCARLPAGTELPALVEARVDRVQSGADVAVLEGGIERVEGRALERLVGQCQQIAHREYPDAADDRGDHERPSLPGHGTGAERADWEVEVREARRRRTHGGESDAQRERQRLAGEDTAPITE